MFAFNENILEWTSLIIAFTGLFLAVVSMVFGLRVFLRTQKNYYKNFLKFLTKKEKKIKKQLKRKKINNPIYSEYLMDDLKFFGENFFVNFSDDGFLMYSQFLTIKGIYRHLSHRLKITRKIFNQLLKKQKDKKIIVRLQLFNKYNYINKTYYGNKLKNQKLAKVDPNVYITIKLTYDRQKKTFHNESLKKPAAIFEMGSDFEFKKKMYFIFSRANEVEKKLGEENIERQYFFVACSTY